MPSAPGNHGRTDLKPERIAIQEVDLTDEEAPLLVGAGNERQTPLPIVQLTIIISLQFVASITYHLIGPFTPRLIKEVGVTKGDDSKIGHYVGILQSSFFAAQGLTVLAWGYVSDRIGRKPVFMVETFGISASMIAFGLSHSYSNLLVSRIAGGVLSGGIGVMTSVIAEITDSTNIAQAYGISPLSWTTAGTVGPLLGGLTSHPDEQFPGSIGKLPFLRAHPYILPCSIPATLALGMMWVTHAFFKETVANPTPPLRFVLGSVFGHQVPQRRMGPAPLSFKSCLTSRVMICTVGLASWSYLDLCIKSILPVFFTTSLELGGMGYDVYITGKCMATLGIINAFSQFILFARFQRALGTKNLFLSGMVATIPVIALFPVQGYITKSLGNHHWSISGLLCVQFVLLSWMNMGYGCLSIYLTSAAPNSQSMGTVSGISSGLVSLVRTFGPFMVGFIYSLTIKTNAMGGWLVWVFLFGVALLAFSSGLLLPSQVWARNE